MQHAQIFVNLNTFNPQFTDENATCMIIGENLFVMLLVEKFFGGFTSKAITDTSKSTEVLTCVSCSGREEVDQLVSKARAAGAKVPRKAQDHGFMYSHGYQDLDGHTWELVHMSGAPPQQ